jgi:hypothetical protein
VLTRRCRAKALALAGPRARIAARSWSVEKGISEIFTVRKTISIPKAYLDQQDRAEFARII